MYGRKSSSKALWIAGALGLAFIGAAVAGMWQLQDYEYSGGQRQGTITKFSHKGILCKTWEGQMAQANLSRDGSRTQAGGVDNTFYFSVDTSEHPEMVQAIKDAMDSGEVVNLQYSQKLFALDYPLIPGACQRGTEYEVEGVKTMHNQPVEKPSVPLLPSQG